MGVHSCVIPKWDRKPVSKSHCSMLIHQRLKDRNGPNLSLMEEQNLAEMTLLQKAHFSTLNLQIYLARRPSFLRFRLEIRKLQKLREEVILSNWQRANWIHPLSLSKEKRFSIIWTTSLGNLKKDPIFFTYKLEIWRFKDH